MSISSSAVFLSVKNLLIFAGTVSLLLATRSLLPLFVAWLRPPYLYFVINGIIIAVVLASRFPHDRLEKQISSQFRPLITARTPPPDDFVDFAPPELKLEEFEGEFGSEKVVELKPVVVNGSVVDLDGEKLGEGDAIVVEEEEVIDSAVDLLPETESEMVLAAEKPLVSSRFAHRKISAKTSPEVVRGLRVARPQKQETLESTWRMITEGRHVPLTRHHQTRHVTAALDSPAPPQPAVARKEPSLSQDELNRRVEAFIKKFNEEMRIQRQQSLQQYMEMINRGAN